MPTPPQQLDVSSAIANVRSAEQSLNNIMSTTSDATVLAGLTASYRVLDNSLTTLLQAQMAADDATFTTATTNLKTQSATLKAQEAEIQKLVANVALAAQIVGYIAQAVTFIAAI
jgi:hypothetical protein